MKNIVILTRRYYPYMSPISAVIDKYIQRLKGKYMFHVICIAGHSSLEKPSDPNVKVYYIKRKSWLLRLWSEENYNETHKKLYYYIMQACRAKAAFVNLFADYLGYKWEKKAYYSEMLKISKENNIDGIISVSGDTVFTHLAAQRYKLEHTTTKWVTFFTDPYTNQDMMFYPALFNKEKNKQKRYKIEKNIYETADYNIATEELYKTVINDFCQPENKTLCFRYVLDDIRSAISPKSVCNESEEIKLMYAGAFYKKIRNPQPVMAIMEKVDNVQFDLYVTSKECDDILEKYKANHIHILDGVPANEYKHKICYEYDILVNVGNDCEYQVPSKMLEYISTGRPILNFYYRKDSQYEMIERYPLGMNVDIHDESVYPQVIDYCKKMKGKQMKYDELEELYPKNSLTRQSKILDDIFSK